MRSGSVTADGAAEVELVTLAAPGAPQLGGPGRVEGAPARGADGGEDARNNAVAVHVPRLPHDIPPQTRETVPVRTPLDAADGSVPSLALDRMVLVDGRTFAISAQDGTMAGGTHGVVHDDLRHLSHFGLAIDGAAVERLAASSPTPLSAVVVARLTQEGPQGARAILTRRRWLAGGLREDIHVHNTGPHSARWVVRVQLLADFLHVFDVKEGRTGEPRGVDATSDLRHCSIMGPDGGEVATIVHLDPAPRSLEDGSVLVWEVETPPRSDVTITLTIEPSVGGERAGLAFPIGEHPADAVPMRRLEAWRSGVPRLVSTDPRLDPVATQAFADLAALRIHDPEHAERVIVAAGAPWFMTIFGRDSLLAAWMALPFEPALATGVLLTLADLQGTRVDPQAEEQPGKILHELRRRGGGGPFASRQRYYGTVDATSLYVMLAAEAHRWGALDDATLRTLAPHIDAALRWIVEHGDSTGDGFVDYLRSDPTGLSNQGWKDSWDGVTYADGRLPEGPVALVEVQGYTYAALTGGAELAELGVLTHSPDELLSRADALRQCFNRSFWDDRGWFALGVDGEGRRIDSLTTNPGHALWAGIADPDLADAYLDRLSEPAMWTGWGLRTLADTMAAYDPLSYHNGSVWPHDTALCAAGAARYRRFDVVDLIYSGALDAAVEFDNRPPELFAGIDRDEAPMPVAYPTSCSPQAWSSASVLLLLRSLLDLQPDRAQRRVSTGRSDLSSLPHLELGGLRVAGTRVSITT